MTNLASENHRPEVGAPGVSVVSVLQVLQGRIQGAGRAAFLSGGSGDERTSMFIQVTGRI